MEFSLRVGDMSFFVFCKLEILIFKIVQVMTENIPFAFLYVLSIEKKTRVHRGIPLFLIFVPKHTLCRVLVRNASPSKNKK